MTTTDYTRLLADYAQACDLIAAQKRQIEALRGALKDMHERHPICYVEDADKDCVVCLCEVDDIYRLKAGLR